MADGPNAIAALEILMKKSHETARFNATLEDDENSVGSKDDGANGERKDWTRADILQLMGLWDAFGSISIAAAIMGRNYAAVQTQASRRQLPKRVINGRNRRRWTSDDDDFIQTYLRKNQRIDIKELASSIERSVDSCVQRLETHHHMPPKDLVKRLTIPESLGTKQAYKICPNCQRPFIRKNSLNYVCAPCKKTDIFKSDF